MTWTTWTVGVSTAGWSSVSFLRSVWESEIQSCPVKTELPAELAGATQKHVPGRQHLGLHRKQKRRHEREDPYASRYRCRRARAGCSGCAEVAAEPVTEEHIQDRGFWVFLEHTSRTRNNPFLSSVVRVSVDIDEVLCPGSKSGKRLDFFLGLIFKMGVG